MNTIITKEQLQKIEGYVWDAVGVWNEIQKGTPLKYLILHCTATPEGREVTPNDIRIWHNAPKTLSDGSVKYDGEIYPNRSALPNNFIGGVSIKDLEGNGWMSLGYSKMILLDGEIEILTPYDGGGIIRPEQITNGVRGQNNWSRHFVYVGGVAKDGKTAKDTRTRMQKITMANMVKNEIMLNPSILVCGHNQFDSKACPSFDVPDWLREIGIDEKNIYEEKRS